MVDADGMAIGVEAVVGGVAMDVLVCVYLSVEVVPIRSLFG